MLFKRTKNKFNSCLIALFIGLATLTSCEDAIYIGPQDEITESNAIENLEDLQSALIGVYSTMGANNDVYWNSLFTDELRLPSTNNGQGIQVHTWSINSGDNTAAALYGSYSTTINRANRVIEAISGITYSPDEQAEVDRINGELLAIRAWGHFKLLTYFGESYTDDSALGVPYIDYVVVLEKPARNTVGEVWNGILADLEAARQLIPNDSSDNIFFTDNAVTALEARIALYRGDNQTAITKSTQLISQYALATSANYANIWNDTNDQENIFKLARTVGDAAIGQIYSPTPQLIYWLASDKITAAYEAGDVRLNAFTIPATQFIKKYPGDATAFGLNDVKVFRISEQYLIRAEAYAKTSQVPLAQADVNMLRSNRGVADVTFSGQQDAVNKIMDERFREFAFEGHRYFDLRRNGFDVDRDGTDCDYLAADACSLSNSDYKFVLPIPQSEIFANPNMEQNPGYTSN